MSQQNEKDEKNEKDEGGWDEKWRRDPVDAATWAIILIWAGIVLLGWNLGWFRQWEVEPWAIGFIGAGLIVFLSILFRVVVPAYRRPIGGSLVLAFVFIGIGLGWIVGWVVVVPLVLIAIGVGLLLTGFFRRRPPQE